MEILQFIMNFLTKNNNGGTIGSIFKLFQENSFDLKRVLRNLKPETVAPIIEAFMSAQKSGNKKTSNSDSFGVAPIAGIADKEIVFSLNKYLGS